MIGAVEIADDDMFAVDIDPAEGTVVEQELRFQSKSRLPPRQLEDGAYQAHEKTPVTD